MSTLTIEEELSNFLTTAYASLRKEYILFTLAMAVLGAILPIFVVWILNRRDQDSVRKEKPYKAYTHRKQAERGIHIAVCLMMPVLVARRLYLNVQLRASVGIYGWEIIVLDLLLAVLSLAAAWNLSRWRVPGLFMAGAFVVLYAVCDQYQNLFAVKADMDFQAGLAPVGGYTLYIVDDYYVTRSMMTSLLAVIVLTLLAGYYYKRRLLFLPGKLKLPRCEHCGQLVYHGNAFCTCCGSPVRDSSAADVIESLDKKPYCGVCGKFTNGGVCAACSKGIADHLKEVASEKKASLGRNAVVAVCMALLLFSNMVGPVKNLWRGSAAANNAFVQRWNEFCDNPDQASDLEWLAGFDSAANALDIMDARWYYIEPRSVKSDELIYFGVYADASFRQMEVIEQIQQAVYAAADGQTLLEEIRPEHIALQEKFNQTIQLQASALQYYGGLSKKWDLLGKLGYMYLDGVHAILPLVNVSWAAIAVLAACVVMLAVLCNHFAPEAIMGRERKIQVSRAKADARISRYASAYAVPDATILSRTAAAGINCGRSLLKIVNEVWMLLIQLAGTAALFISLFRLKNIGSCMRWLKTGLTNPKDSHVASYEAYMRSEQKATMIAILVVAVIFAVPFGMTLLGSGSQIPSDDQTYLTAAKAAATDYSVDISKLVSVICSTGSLTEERKEQLYALIDVQIEADQTILNYDISQLEGYQKLHAGLCSLCRDDIDALQRLRAVIEEGRIPSKELQKNYDSLRGANYLWILQRLLPEFAVLNVGLIFDL